MNRLKASLLLLLFLLIGPAFSAEVTLTFLNVEQGDAILVQSEGKTALIDAGPRGCNLVSLLRQRDIAGLDLVVVSHHHADHIGEMADAVKTFRARFFLDSGSPTTTRLYRTLLQAVQATGARYLKAGERTIAIGSTDLKVFPMPPAHPDHENDNCVGIRVVCGSFSAVLTGDSEEYERAWWLAHADPALYRDATVLKLAHHGSRNGIDPEWLGAVNPELAVVSLGAGNRYGHPHPQALALLRKRKTRLLRTDRDGTIVIHSDGDTYRVEIDKERLSAGGTDPAASAGAIDPNTASPSELETLPGVGPVLARRIVEGRPYRSLQDLLQVKGIGKALLAKIEPYLEIR